MRLRAQPARLLAVDPPGGNTRLLLLPHADIAAGSAAGTELRILGRGASARHALIGYARGRHYIRDLKSAGGTFLNGKRIRRTRILTHGDHIRFGTSLRYRFLDPDYPKRLRARRLAGAGGFAAVIALAAVAHAKHFDGGLFSIATVDEIAADVRSAAATVLARESRTPVAMATATPAPAATAKAPASAATPIARATPLKSAAEPAWLERLNRYRTMAGLAPLIEDKSASAGDAAHARYLLENYFQIIQGDGMLGDAGHDEKPGKPGYSAAGAEIARNSELAWGCDAFDAAAQIDRWFAGPFHRIWILNPLVQKAGFGSSAKGGCWAAGLRLDRPADESRRFPHAIEFPAAGAAVSLAWANGETPNPLTSCDGYTMPTGLPITLQIGRMFDVKLTTYSISTAGKALESCAFSAREYRNPSPTAQEYGRWTLRRAGAVVLIPRAPLTPGTAYQVSIAASGRTYHWSFSVAH
jgi:FHA domain/Cysteine-rich secretory protein family